MAEFYNVIKNATRLCDESKCCEECCLFMNKNCMLEIISSLSDKELKDFETTVMKWSKNNPEKTYPTWENWWATTFPDTAEYMCPCPRYFTNINCNKYNSCIDCKNTKIPNNIAKKLGIKPIIKEN